jgi:Cu2+-exporting ATPase
MTLRATAAARPVRRASAAGAAMRDPARCFHCGDVNPPGARWRTDIDGAAAHFCCAGCLAVTQTIRAAGLTTFYALRDRDAVPAVCADDDWRRADAAAAAAGLVRSVDAGLHEVALLVDGIRCGACVWLLETWLERQPGVREARVNLATRRARLRYDDGRIGLAEILHAVAQIGYRAHPYDPARREALARSESRALLLRAGLALLGMMQVMMFAVPAYVSVGGVEPRYQALLNWASLILTLPVVLYCATPFFVGAWRDLRIRRPGMDVPIALGVAGAFGASAWATVSGSGDVYFDSVTMFVALVLVARLIELRVRERAGDALEAIAREMPQTAERLGDYPRERTAETIPAAALAAGDFVRIATGAPIPADGSVVEGRSSVEEAVLTGESWPQAKAPGDRVLAGSVNRGSPLIVRVSAAGEATTLCALARLVERAASARPRVARVSDRVAAAFVASLLGIAAVSALAWWSIDASRALPVALAVLVVSCPCALSLATPAALASAAAALGRRQVLCVRPDALETLSRVTHVVLDKTGTLTTGDVRLLGLTAFGGADPEACRSLAAALEEGSAHPIARALDGRAGRRYPVQRILAMPGCGVEGVIDGRRHRFGRADWVAQICAAPMPADLLAAAPGQTLATLADDANWIAAMRFGDTLREGAPALVAALHELGLRVSMVSGDRAAAVEHVAHAVGIADWHGNAKPDDKRSFIAALQRRGAIVAMLGDGINDAPGLASADVSLALGSAATLTQWTADAVVLGDDLRRVAFALRAARRTFRVIRENLGWALLYNLVAIPLAACGQLSPLAAAVGMSASSLVVVGNAWRLSRMGRRETDTAVRVSAGDGASRIPTALPAPAVR